MALVDKTPRSASVVAAEPTVALELTRDVFEGLLHARNPLAVRFQEQIAIAGIRQLRMATERLREAISRCCSRRGRSRLRPRAISPPI
jgi:CRP-like cAMP-binding protein